MNLLLPGPHRPLPVLCHQKSGSCSKILKYKPTYSFSSWSYGLWTSASEVCWIRWYLICPTDMGFSKTLLYGVFVRILRSNSRPSAVSTLSKLVPRPVVAPEDLHRTFLKGSNLSFCCSDSGISKLIPVAALCTFGRSFCASLYPQPWMLHLPLQGLSFNSSFIQQSCVGRTHGSI